MSKERARRRAARLAQVEVARVKRERQQARRRRRQAMLRRMVPDRRTGRIFARRGRGERAAIAVLTLAGAGAVWLLVDALALRLALIALLLVALPAFVVIALGRRT